LGESQNHPLGKDFAPNEDHCFMWTNHYNQQIYAKTAKVQVEARNLTNHEQKETPIII